MFLYLEDIYSQNDWADSVYSKVQQYHQYTLKNIMRFYRKKFQIKILQYIYSARFICGMKGKCCPILELEETPQQTHLPECKTCRQM